MVEARAAAPASGLSAEQLEGEIHRQVNAYRRSRGLPPLILDPDLSRVARDHARSMANRGRISHAGFDRRFRRLQGAGFVGLAENLAMNRGHADPARTSVESWRNSRGHHRHLVTRRHPHTGVGVARTRDGRVYCTQLFGTRETPHASGRTP